MRLGVKSSEEVVFEQLQHGAYRDGIKFTNGKEISLQFLGSGVVVTLVQLHEKPRVACEREKTLESIA
jgi:hypothetical protein